jgi:predicted amidophosphoribosyltransferase
MLEALWPSQCAGCGTRHDGRLCARCTPVGIHRVPLTTPATAGALTLAGYDTPLGRALRTAKLGPDRALTWTLATHFGIEMARALRGGTFSAIVPVPTPWRRRVQRGFSIPAILAAHLSASTGLPVRRVLQARSGPRQATLNRRARRENLRGRIRSVDGVPGRVCLVDDVVTTGATSNACAQELLGSQTSEVWLLTVCAQRLRNRQGMSQVSQIL